MPVCDDNVVGFVSGIHRLGPLGHHWTMRFEARHRYFKCLASQLGNFINVCYTLAMRHQQQQCYYNLDTSAIGSEEPEIGPGCSVSREMVSGLTLPTCCNLYR